MTFPELRLELAKLKPEPLSSKSFYNDSLSISCDSETHNTIMKTDTGLHVEKRDDYYEVYTAERGYKQHLLGTFDSEHNVCEYVFYHYKAKQGDKRWWLIGCLCPILFATLVLFGIRALLIFVMHLVRT